MKTLLRSFVCFVCFAGLSATAHAQKNVQKSDATATRDEITADLKFGTGRTGTFLTGSALTLNSGSTLTLNGALAGTPTGGTLNLSALTLNVPEAFRIGTTTTTNLVFEGDSLTEGNALPAGQDYPTALMLLSRFANQGTKYNVAIGGSTLAQLSARYTANVYPRRPTGAITKAYLFVWIGANDYGTAVAATYLADLETYWAQAKADGFTVVAFTITTPSLSLATIAANETVRQAINKGIRQSLTPDFLVDVDAQFPDSADTIYKLEDRIHFTYVGNKAVARLVNNVIAAGGQLRPLGFPVMRAPLATNGLLFTDTSGALVTSSDMTVEPTTRTVTVPSLITGLFEGTSTTEATLIGAGAGKLAGGLYLAKKLITNSTADAIALDTGSIISQGGMSLRKNAIVGNNLVVAGTISAAAALANTTGISFYDTRWGVGVDGSSLVLTAPVASAFAFKAESVTGTAWATLNATGFAMSGTVTGTRLISNVATGTAPLTVASTTNVANLNASSLNGATFASPGAIGGTTPSTGAFTTLSATNNQSAGSISTFTNSTSATGAYTALSLVGGSNTAYLFQFSQGYTTSGGYRASNTVLQVPTGGGFGITYGGSTEIFRVDGSTGAVTSSGDVEVSDIGEGVIIKSPNGTRWRLTVSNAGAVVVTSL